MRYLLLFILAVLLPVFAFMNFSEGGALSSMSSPFKHFKSIENGNDAKNTIDDNSFLARLVSEDTLEEDGEDMDVVVEGSLPVADDIVVGEEDSSEEVGEAFGFAKKNSGTQDSEVVLSSDEKSSQIISSNLLNEYKIPQMAQVEPIRLPLTSTVSAPYLESFKSPNFFPIRDWSVQAEDVSSKSALAIEPFTHKILYSKNIFDLRPVASLSKLMTALVVIDEMDLNSIVTVSSQAVSTYGEQGGLMPSERITVENLLYILLISSSNDAAIAIEEYYNSYRTEGDKTFVAAMNAKAQKLGLIDTFFVEPSGLNVNNRSTAYDMALLADYVFQRPILRQIMSTQTVDVQSIDDTVNHHLVNSNKLLGVMEGVLAGKTGYTEEAGESLALYAKKSSDIDDYLIYIVLGADDRVKAARQMIDWVDRAYIWE